MKVLNLYADLGGNRKLWDDCYVTAVENVDSIADVYETLYPDDTVIRTDAHQYLLDHHHEYDYVWSSPPCPTHSKLRLSHTDPDVDQMVYPDMTLYQEIIWLKHFFGGHWVVENVESYYDPLITPTVVMDRHYFWSSYPITRRAIPKHNSDVSRATKEQLSDHLGIRLPDGTPDQRKLYRNAVHPDLGLHIYRQTPRQTSLFDTEEANDD